MLDFTSAIAVFTGFLTIFGIGLPIITPSTKQATTLIPQMQIMLDSSYTAKSILIANIADDSHLAERAINDIRPIASLTKIMTGLLAIEILSPNTPIIMSKDAVSTPGDLADFQAGEVVIMRDALYALMMPSSNHIAMAIAETVGDRLGGKTFDEKIERFVHMMNERARFLNMKDTIYRNPTGLDLKNNEPSNLSSANDILKLLRFSLNTPILWEPSRESQKIVTSFGQRRHVFTNRNPLTPYIVNLIGTKTGTTKASGENIIIIYEEILGTPQAIIILGAQPGQRVIEAESLLIKTGGMVQ